MPSFTVRVIAVGENDDLNAFVVVMAEHEDGGGERLEIQRALAFNDSDRELGMDTYCLSMASGKTHYGGLKSYRLQNGVLSISVDDEAQAELGVDERFVLGLETEQELARKLLDGIERATLIQPES